MPYGARVRPARSQDLDEIVRLFRDSLNEHDQTSDLSEYGSATILEHVRRHTFPEDTLHSDSVHSYVVEVVNSENILGYASVTSRGEVVQIFVPPDLRSKGYGNLLMAYLKKQYGGHGGLFARVVRGHRKFWKNYHFRVIEEVDIENINGCEKAYVMSWDYEESEEGDQ